MPIDTYQYQVPLNEQDQNRTGETMPGQYPHVAFETEQQIALDLSARAIEEQATPVAVREAEIDLFDDRTNLNYLQDEYKTDGYNVQAHKYHETVAPVHTVETQNFTPEMAQIDIKQGTYIHRAITVAQRLQYERKNRVEQ